MKGSLGFGKILQGGMNSAIKMGRNVDKYKNSSGFNALGAGVAAAGGLFALGQVKQTRKSARNHSILGTPAHAAGAGILGYGSYQAFKGNLGSTLLGASRSARKMGLFKI